MNIEDLKEDMTPFGNLRSKTSIGVGGDKDGTRTRGTYVCRSQ